MTVECVPLNGPHKSQRTGKGADREEDCEMLSLGHDMATVLLNSPLLWFPEQGQAKKISQYSSRSSNRHSKSYNNKTKTATKAKGGNMRDEDGMSTC